MAVKLKEPQQGRNWFFLPLTQFVFDPQTGNELLVKLSLYFYKFFLYWGHSVSLEEATKAAFVMPFIRDWGYDVFDPTEVIPEYTADLPGLKGEKVDYAICKDGKPIILIECKSCKENLDQAKHNSQLHRYYHATDSELGILTNGILYRFYTDTDKDNVMDDRPFFEFNFLNFDDSAVTELKRFSKNNFNPNELGNIARNLLYTRGIKSVISEQLNNPSPDFVKFFIGQVYSGKATQSVVEKFTELTKTSLKEYINDKITERLKDAINKGTEAAPAPLPVEQSSIEEPLAPSAEETESFYIVKSILGQVVDTARIKFKKNKSNFIINIDGKTGKVICRLNFNEKSGKKEIIIPDNLDSTKNSTNQITNLDEIYGVAEFLKSRVRYLTDNSYTAQPEQSEII
ncbi:MAG: type I restriction endonuclease [Cyanobacteriota bacterium ELA615]